MCTAGVALPQSAQLSLLHLPYLYFLLGVLCRVAESCKEYPKLEDGIL
jgi:hypothetical protein